MHAGDLIQSRYELTEPLGQGGMAEVWQAQDSHLGRPVAIKFLARRLATDPEFLVRFFSEAQAVAGISHPNVVKVLDFGEHEETPYLVMECVTGGPLTDLTGEPHEPDWALEVVGAAARAAGAAHAQGIVHRDIKPGNILLDEVGVAKLADFGIASSGRSERLTATGAAIGSPHYISPEQASGGDATPASDVYALGIVLYELLTGVRPFEGENVTAVAIAQVEQDPAPPSSHVPELNAAIDALILRCLAKDPADRFADGDELAAALERFDARDVEVVPTPAIEEEDALWAHRKLAVIAAVVIALAAIPLLGMLDSGEGRVAASVEDEDPGPLPNVGGLKLKKSPSPSLDGSENVAAPLPTPTKTPKSEPQQEDEEQTETDESDPEPTPEPTEPEPSPSPTGSPAA